MRISTPSLTVPFPDPVPPKKDDIQTNAKINIATGTVALLFALVLIPLSGGTKNQILNQSQPEPQNAPPKDAQINDNVVYVCACLKTKSCPCMTEAKMEGPCACGTAGGPPLKPVAKNSDWAKTNRKTLGQ